MGAEGFRPHFAEVPGMKLVLLMGSPRKNGNTAALTAPFLEECGRLGIETETFWLYDKTILPVWAARPARTGWTAWAVCGRTTWPPV